MSEISRAMDQMQKGLDFSFAVADIKRQPLTKEQQAAKERMLGNMKLMETPEHDARFQELINM